MEADEPVETVGVHNAAFVAEMGRRESEWRMVVVREEITAGVEVLLVALGKEHKAAAGVDTEVAVEVEKMQWAALLAVVYLV